jgi:nuclear receptor interaction protein
VVQLRQTIFGFSAGISSEMATEMETARELTPHTSILTQSLGQCSAVLPDMDEIIRTWTYPMNPSEEDVLLQNTLRRNRQASWRFIQASGCLSRVLGGKLQTVGSTPDPRLRHFTHIMPASLEGKTIRPESRFCYDFLKAILCWLDGGQSAVLEAFRRPPSISSDSPRFPLTEGFAVENSVQILHEYLNKLADEEKPVVDLDSNRFERDETRNIFPHQKAAVQAFIRALESIELQVNQGISKGPNDPQATSNVKRVMDKGAAARFWGLKVGRSLLMEAAEGITFDFVNRAFGGLRVRPADLETERSQEDVDSNEDERIVESVDIVTTEGSTVFHSSTSEPTQTVSSSETLETSRHTTESTSHGDDELHIPAVVVGDVEGSVTQPSVDVDHHDDGNEDSDVDNGEDDDDDDDEEDSNDDEEDAARTLFRRRIAYGRSRERAAVNLDAPYSSHTRVYKGHCNTRTVKDVNYYGLNDEYVVSGSDDGHFFIWDRKTGKVVNILEGDGEVVNVIQGHPYEPMIACSGIDSTVKIFGPGGENREREAASRGINVANPGGSVHSSLGGGRRRRRARDSDDEDEADTRQPEPEGVSCSGLRSRKAMHKEYEITSQNDAERRRGYGDAFVTVSSMEDFFTRAWILSGLELELA